MNPDVLLAAGLLLSTASQLRIGSLPVGPGELCLVAWLVLRLPVFIQRPGPPLSPAFRRMGVFWLCLSLALATGTLTGLLQGETYDPRWFLHDVFAYPLLAAVSCAMVAGRDAASRLQRVAGMACDLGIVSLCLILALAAELVALPNVNPWFWERLRGWSDNPNQLAVLCLSLALTALHVVETATTVGAWVRGIICLVLAVWVGRLSQSDGCTFSMIGAGLVFAAVKLRAWVSLRKPERALRSAAAWIAVLSLPFILAVGVPLMLASPDAASTFAASLEKGGGKYAADESALRFALWRQALRRSLQSGMLGLGPGPHLQMPAEIAADHVSGMEQSGNTQRPEQGAMANYEAHNTPLDLLTQGGLLLVISFFWLLTVALRGVYKSRYAGLTAMLCGLTLFSLTGLIIRHPFVWFGVALCLATRDQAAEGLVPARPRAAVSARLPHKAAMQKAGWR